MTKKVNCKDGLTHKEEIQARRLRRSLEDGDGEYTDLVRSLYKEWYKKPQQSFLQWLIINGYGTLSSALKRMDDWSKVVS